MSILNRHFGKITAIVVFAIVLMLNSAGYNASSYKKITGLHIIYYFILLLLFFSMLYFFYQGSKITFKILYVFLIMATQSYIISSIAKYAELENKSSPFLEKNAAINLSAIISVPIALLIVLTIGFVFDYIKTLTYKTKRKQS